MGCIFITSIGIDDVKALTATGLSNSSSHIHIAYM